MVKLRRLTKIISLECGKAMQVKYIDSKEEPIIHGGPEEIAKEIDVPVNIIDEWAIEQLGTRPNCAKCTVWDRLVKL